MPGQHPGHQVDRIWVGVATNSDGDEMIAGMFIPSMGALGPMVTSEARLAEKLREVAPAIGQMNNETIEVREYVRLDDDWTKRRDGEK